MKCTESVAVYLIVCFLLGSVAADPSVCYYCTTDADGQACDNPINDRSIRIQHCGNLTVTENTGNLEGNTAIPTNGTYACTTLTYTSTANAFVTIRECQVRQVEGMDICTYLSQSSATLTRTRDFSCKTCLNDLCNSAATLRLSTAVLFCFFLMKLLSF